MKPHIIVPDASVLLKWVAPITPEEQDVEKALSLRQGWIDDKYTIHLPGIWLYEVANVLGCKVPDFAEALIETFIEYPFNIVEINSKLCSHAFRIMKKHKTAFYDSIYHAVAIQNRGLLVTADDAYYKKSKSEGHITLLKDFAFS